MSSTKIVVGVVIIILGILMLCANFSLITWQFVADLWKLWPLVVIIAGIEMVFKGNSTTKSIVYLLLILVSFFIFYFAERHNGTVNYSCNYTQGESLA